MTAALLPLLVGSSTALGLWSIVQLILSRLNPEQRRLQQRLTGTPRSTDPQNHELRALRLSAEKSEHFGLLLNKLPLGELGRAIVQAFPNLTPQRFMSIAAGSGIGVLMIVFVITGSPIVSLVGGVLGVAVPFLVLAHKRTARQKAISLQIPNALDFLGRALRAGHSLSSGLQMMGTELPDPLASEFRRAYDQHSLGVPMEVALREMTMRIESTDFAFFITAVLVQRQTGGDLSEVLANISDMIRQRVQLEQHVKAKTAEGRFTGYVLAAFPSLMFVITSVIRPEYTKPLTNTTLGIAMLVGALVLQLCGLLLIRKLTKLTI